MDANKNVSYTFCNCKGHQWYQHLLQLSNQTTTINALTFIYSLHTQCFGRQLQPLSGDTTAIYKVTWGIGSSSIYLHIVVVSPDDSPTVGQNKSGIWWIIWMLEHLWCCTDSITPENIDWRNTTLWRYPNLHQRYISKRYSWAVNHGVYIKCEHFRSMLHYLQVTHPTVLCCVTGLATFTFITMAFLLLLLILLWMNTGVIRSQYACSLHRSMISDSEM
jgi:hypothetical protein